MSNNPSPVTGVIEENSVVCDFGIYAGETVATIATKDPEFYAQMIEAKEKGNYSIRRTKDRNFRLYLNPLAELDH